MITKQSLIEDLIKAYPDLVSFLIKEGLPCVICGEPFWGTIEALARQKNWDDTKIDNLVDKMNKTYS